MHKVATTALAILLGAAWTIAPALAADPEGKKEGSAQKVEEKGEGAKDKVESTMDKVKAKAREAKEKVKEKMGRAEERQEAADVRAAQQALRDKGHDPGPIDGAMGPQTAAAVRAFQKAEGLETSGTLDSMTMDKLGVKAAAASPRTDAPADTQKKDKP